jgi:hypothetical protein
MRNAGKQNNFFKINQNMTMIYELVN